MALRDLIPRRKTRSEREEALVPAHEEAKDLFRETFEDFFRPWFRLPWRRPFGEAGAFAPAVNVSETDKDYRISVDLPGMDKEDVEVTVSEGRVTIGGEKKEEEKEEKENYLRLERSYGSFTRTIPLPSSVKEDAIEASFKMGVLEILLPKTEEARGKKVQIKSG